LNARTRDEIYDVAIIGGGVNGCGIARDAAGRGVSVVLLEQGDFAGATSSASTKLIHGGLRYLEHYEFRLVHEALAEREVLWAIAPHIIWPLRFVLPHHAGLRPAWLLRLGLFLYDHLGGRKLLPATRSLDLARDPAGRPLREGYRRAFEYSDCWVEDSRLVVLNALDAAERGADIRRSTRVVSASREPEFWRIEFEEAGARRVVNARALVNAAGPRAGRVAAMAGIPLPVEGKKRCVFVVHCRTPIEKLPLLVDPSGFYIRPEGAYQICGAPPAEDNDPDADGDFEVDWSIFEENIWPNLAHRIPAMEELKVVRAWAGHYEMNLLDHNAVIGPHPEVGNFYFLNGFSGHGLQQAPAAGRAIAEWLVQGRSVSLDLDVFSYERIAAGRPHAELNII